MLRKILYIRPPQEPMAGSVFRSKKPRALARGASLVVAASLFVFAMSKLSFAMMCGNHSGNQQMAQAHSEHEHSALETNKEIVPEEAEAVGNKICPVSGEKIDEETKLIYEYEGKVYNFCCASCIEEFKEDPEKYIKKIDEELQAESKEESGTHQDHNH